MQLFNEQILDRQLAVALSGGVDSIALLHFLIKRGYDVSIAHYVHKESETAEDEFLFVSNIAKELDLNLFVGYQTEQKRTKQSLEEYWRAGRMEFLTSLDIQVVSGHHLDDVVEWYVFTCLTGEGHFMPFRYQNVVRPLVTTSKGIINQYAVEHNLKWIEDPTNNNLVRARNRIRHNIMPEALQINPGLYSVVRKRMIEKYTETKQKSSLLELASV